MLGHELGVVVHVDAVSADQLHQFRGSLVPRRPVTASSDVAPVLIVAADGSVIPMTHDVSPPSARVAARRRPRLWRASGWPPDTANASPRRVSGRGTSSPGRHRRGRPTGTTRSRPHAAGRRNGAGGAASAPGGDEHHRARQREVPPSRYGASRRSSSATSAARSSSVSTASTRRKWPFSRRQLRPVRRGIRSGAAAVEQDGLDIGRSLRFDARRLPPPDRRACRTPVRTPLAPAPSTSPTASRGAANHGFSAGDAQSAVTIRPPGSSTRPSSRSVATGSAAAITESRLTTASNDASANGSTPLKSPRRARARRPPRLARRAASSSCVAFVSNPVTSAPASASATVSRPLPQPASSTCSA